MILKEVFLATRLNHSAFKILKPLHVTCVDISHVCVVLLLCRSGVGAPVIGDLDGEYKHDSRRNVLEWCLPVIDANNKTGSLEFSIAGQPNDFFPISVSFVSKRNYCDIQVGY